MPHIPRQYKGPMTSKAPLASRPSATLYDLPVEPAPLTQGGKPTVQRNPVVRKAKKPFMQQTSMANWEVLPDDVLAVMEND